MSKTEDLVFSLAAPIAESEGVEIYDVEYKKEGKDWFLRVFLYSEQGITIDDCENVSRKLSDELDRLDPIDAAYYLEVSSPGIDRPLRLPRHFETAIGETIEITLYSPINGRKKMSGILLNYEDGRIYMTEAETGEPFEIEKKAVARAAVIGVI